MPPLSSSDDLLAGDLKQIGRFSARFAQRDHRAAEAIAGALRRIRALLPVLDIDPALVHKLDSRTKRAIARLKKLRDVDVLLSLVDELADSERVSRAAIAGVRNAVRQSAAATDAARLRRKTVGELERLCERLAAVPSTARDASQPAVALRIRQEFPARASAQAAALRRALAEAGTVYLVDRLRSLRRTVHHMRDEVRPLAVASPVFGAADVRALDRAAELLDRMRDLRRVITQVRDTQKTLTPPDLPVWHQLDSLIVAIERRSRRLHARLLRERQTLLRLCVRLAARPIAARPRRKAS